MMCVFLACSLPQGATAASTPASFKPDDAQYAMRGDPGFSEDSLTDEQRKWYDRLWAAIENPEQYPNATKLAKSGDSYLYRGDLQDYDNSLLTVFRLTGDLRLLDEVSRVSELMRKELKDAWHGTRDGKNGKKDGFLNWVNLYDNDKKFKGKDTQMAYDLKANAHVALFAWAFENNRDLQSPNGYNYGEQADFWKDYLVNDFEAKWRKRNGVKKGFPFAEHFTFHTYHSFMKWHHYMGKLTGKSAYTKEAERMAKVLWKNFKETPSSYGAALVWPRALTYNRDTWADYLIPQHYARYVIQEAVDLHFEEFGEYAKDSTLEKLANSVADFVIDTSSFNSFARDIGGGKARGGLSASPSSVWNKMDQDRFSISAWSFLSLWDRSSDGLIAQAAGEVYKGIEDDSDHPRRIFIPSAMIIYNMLEDGS